MKKSLFFILTFLYTFSFSQVLDNSFVNGGISTYQLSNVPSSDYTCSAALQNDGKMVYVGRGIFDRYAFVARVNTNGQFDTTFNNFGFKKFNLAGFDSVFIQLDGKILVSGLNIIARLNTDGSLDNTFNSIGFVSISINSQNFNSKSIIQQSNGSILVSGFVNNGSNNDFAVIKLNSDGIYDTNFSLDGKSLFPIGNSNDESFGMALQSDGKIILTGQTFNGSNNDFATIRINVNGTIDTSFAISGIAILQFSGQDYGRSVEVQPDGKIVVVGSGTTSKLYVLRYNVNGTLDGTFDNNGILASTISLTTSLISNSNVTVNRPKLKIFSNGKILISGTSMGKFALIQLNSDGTSDNTFGTNGYTESSFSSTCLSNFLIVNSSNEIITGGGITDNSTFYKMQKLQFSNVGVFQNETSYNLILGSDSFKQMFEQTNGKIVALINSTEGQSIRRFNIDGSLDLSFGNNGLINGFDNSVFKMEQQNDKILITLFYTSISRYTSDGQIDTTFGVNGILDFSLNTSNYVSFIDDLYYDQNSDFIYVGFDYDESIDNSSTPYLRSFGILRLNNMGNIDTTFGVNGISKVRFNFYDPTSVEFPSEINIQSNGKILVSGFLNSVTLNENSALGITRFNYNGTLDTTFGTNGKVVTQIDNKNFPLQMLSFPDNKFIINSSYTLIASNINLLTRTIKYNSNGSLDTTFGNNAIVDDSSNKNDMIIQSDGKIIKAGRNISNFGIVRYNTDGTLDTNFGNAGLLSTPINYFSEINKILLLQNGKLLAGGNSFNGTNTLATFAKYTDLNLGTLYFNNINSLLIYPNPIQSEAIVKYYLENDENISINIFDIQGREILNILQNKYQTKGAHNQYISVGNKLSSGNYILKISTSAGSQSLKFIVK